MFLFRFPFVVVGFLCLPAPAPLASPSLHLPSSPPIFWAGCESANRPEYQGRRMGGGELGRPTERVQQAEEADGAGRRGGFAAGR